MSCSEEVCMHVRAKVANASQGNKLSLKFRVIDGNFIDLAKLFHKNSTLFQTYTQYHGS